MRRRPSRQYRDHPPRYDRDLLRYPAPAPWIGYHPVTYRGGGMIYGFEGGGWAPFDPEADAWIYRYEGDYTPIQRPRESSTYGRRGDREIRRWARRHGYKVEAVIRPGPAYGRRRVRGRRHGHRASGYDGDGRGRRV